LADTVFAAETEGPRLLGHKLDGRGGAGGQLPDQAQGREHQPCAAFFTLAPVEDQAHRATSLDSNGGGVVSVVDDNAVFLDTGIGGGCGNAGRCGAAEPHENQAEQQA